MEPQEIHDELEKLAARLEQIERLLGLTAPKEHRAVPEPEQQRRELAAGPSVAPPPAALAPTHTRAKSIGAVLDGPTAPVSPEVGIREPAAQARRRAARRLERLIGERWMAWVGALVVVAAVGFFVKLAYDLGWWGRLSPLTKCLVAASFGVLLLIAGEMALRRLGRAAAVGFFGAGLGTLYLTAYATFRYFALLSGNGAFWLMLLVALLGFAITLRARMLIIGVLSLIGGYASPMLLAEIRTFPAGLPLYVTMLLAIALGLSAARPDAFRVLRYVGLVLHALIATLWTIQEGTEHWKVAMTFSTLWWALVTAEVLLAALRGQSPRGNAAASLFATIWYASVGCGVLATANPGERNWLGVFTAAVATACALVALPFGPGLSVLRQRPRRAMDKLAVTLWAQVGILVAAAIGLQYREPNQSFGQTIGWLAMGVACIEIGRRLPSRGVGGFGLIVGALALWRVWTVDPAVPLLRRQVWGYGDVSVTNWSLLALGAVAATFVGGMRWCVHGGRRRAKLPIVLTLLAALQWMALCVAQCSDFALTGGWLLAAVGLLLPAPVGRRHGFRGIALFVLMAVAGKWLAFDALLPRLDSGWSAAGSSVLVNWQMGLGLAICAGFCWGYRQFRPRTPTEDDVTEPVARPTGSVGAQIVLGIGVLLLLVALSCEIDRAIGQSELRRAATASPVWSPAQVRALWWTLLWAAGGLAALFGARAVRLKEVFNLGWALLICAALTWLAVDTLLWRIGHGVAPSRIVLNLQFLVGLGVAGMLAAAGVATWRMLSAAELGISREGRVALAVGLILALGLWLGSLEIDRYFAPEAGRVSDPAMARQTGLSIYWGLYGIGVVGLGFWRRSTPMRYAGLGLLTVALAKVLLLDLAKVKYFYRVLSLLGVGLLLLATSAVYAKLATRLEESGHRAN